MRLRFCVVFRLISTCAFLPNRRFLESTRVRTGMQATQWNDSKHDVFPRHGTRSMKYLKEINCYIFNLCYGWILEVLLTEIMVASVWCTTAVFKKMPFVFDKEYYLRSQFSIHWWISWSNAANMPRGRSTGVKSVSKSRQPRTEKIVRPSTSTQHDDQGFRKRQLKSRGDNSRRRFQRRRYSTFGCLLEKNSRQPSLV